VRPLCGQTAASPGPEAAALPRWASKWRPRRASSDDAARGTRFERLHRRREVHAATVAESLLEGVNR
jgi:hypothetical protein